MKTKIYRMRFSEALLWGSISGQVGDPQTTEVFVSGKVESKERYTVLSGAKRPTNFKHSHLQKMNCSLSTPTLTA